MSIFEDLIEELKEENLLEETVIEFHEKNDALNKQAERTKNANYQAENAAAYEKSQQLTQLSSAE